MSTTSYHLLTRIITTVPAVTPATLPSVWNEFGSLSVERPKGDTTWSHWPSVNNETERFVTIGRRKYRCVSFNKRRLSETRGILFESSWSEFVWDRNDGALERLTTDSEFFSSNKGGGRRPKCCATTMSMTATCPAQTVNGTRWDPSVARSDDWPADKYSVSEDAESTTIIVRYKPWPYERFKVGVSSGPTCRRRPLKNASNALKVQCRAVLFPTLLYREF